MASRIKAVFEIRQKMNWPRFIFELAIPSLNRPFKNDTFSSHFRPVARGGGGGVGRPPPPPVAHP